MIKDESHSTKWCPVCDGHGGWDIKSFKPRFRERGDTNQTYLPCIWCGISNVLRKVS